MSYWNESTGTRAFLFWVCLFFFIQSVLTGAVQVTAVSVGGDSLSTLTH